MPTATAAVQSFLHRRSDHVFFGKGKLVFSTRLYVASYDPTSHPQHGRERDARFRCRLRAKSIAYIHPGTRISYLGDATEKRERHGSAPARFWSDHLSNSPDWKTSIEKFIDFGNSCRR